MFYIFISIISTTYPHNHPVYVLYSIALQGVRGGDDYMIYIYDLYLGFIFMIHIYVLYIHFHPGSAWGWCHQSEGFVRGFVGEHSGSTAVKIHPMLLTPGEGGEGGWI